MVRHTSRKPSTEYSRRAARAKAEGFSGYRAKREESARLLREFATLAREGKVDYVPKPRSTIYQDLLKAKGRLHAGKEVTEAQRKPFEREFGKEPARRLIGQWVKSGVRFVPKGGEWYDPEVGYRPQIDFKNKKFKTDDQVIAWMNKKGTKAGLRSKQALVAVWTGTAYEIHIDLDSPGG